MDDDAEPSPARKKRALKVKAKARAGETTSANANQDPAATASTASTPSVSHWTGLPPLPNPTKRKGNDSRELEKSEAIILQCQQMKCALEDPDQVLKLTLQKVTSLQEKVAARLTDELTAVYQEAIRATGPQGRATKVWEGLKDAQDLLGSTADFIEALHDAEACPTTLSSRALALATESKVTLPPSISVLICRRRAEDLAAKRQWADVCNFLNPECKADFPDGIACIMQAGTEIELTKLPPDLVDFQVSCILGCVTNLFMQQISAKTDEEKTKQLQSAIEDVVAFLAAVKVNPVSATAASCGKASVFDELAKLLVLAEAASKANTASLDTELFSSANCDQLEAIKNVFLKARTSTFYPSLTMFPVGIEICNRIGNVAQQVRADALLSHDLEGAALYANSLKPWNVESLLKDNQEVSIPSVVKLADMVGKWLMLREKGSQSLKACPIVQEKMQLVQTKVVELQSVLRDIMRLKYKANFEGMAGDIAKLVKGGQADVEIASLTTSISSSLTQMSAFQPMAKVPLVKVLGKTMAEASMGMKRGSVLEGLRTQDDVRIC